ncbi:TPA: hypothetical protein DCW54_00355 [Candidatus Dependentiae bacterium]|nr:hypothetical protein [Candidatus Dependentiae bacterium]
MVAKTKKYWFLLTSLFSAFAWGAFPFVNDPNTVFFYQTETSLEHESEDQFTSDEIGQMYQWLGSPLVKNINKPKKPKSLSINKKYEDKTVQETLSILLTVEEKGKKAGRYTKFLAEQKLCSDIAELFSQKRYCDAETLIKIATTIYQPISRFFLIKEDNPEEIGWQNFHDLEMLLPFARTFKFSLRPTRDITALVCTASKKILFVGYEDGFVIRTSKSNSPEILGISKSPIQKLFLNENKEVLFSLNSKGLFNIWHLPTREKIATHNLQIQPKYATINLEKTKLKIVDEKNNIHIWTLKSLTAHEALFFKSCQMALGKNKKHIELPQKGFLRELFISTCPLISQKKQKYITVASLGQPNNQSDLISQISNTRTPLEQKT